MAKVIGFEKALLRECKCRQCSAIIEHALNEVKSKQVSCMGDSDTEYFINCPNCGAEVYGVKRF